MSVFYKWLEEEGGKHIEKSTYGKLGKESDNARKEERGKYLEGEK